MSSKSRNNSVKKIFTIIGTRPELVKLAPVIIELQKSKSLESHVCFTGQHREMLKKVQDTFGIFPDADLALMIENQGLAQFTSKAVVVLDKYFQQTEPDMVIVQGDTSTTFAASIAAFYRKIPVAHVEAGLRTRMKYSPFPEEMNRTLVSHIVDLHFAPTSEAAANLMREDIPKEKILITGNTVIDALQLAVKEAKKNPPVIPGIPRAYFSEKLQIPIVLITCHRREHFERGLDFICKAVQILAENFDDHVFVLPVHLNPIVRSRVHHYLKNISNIYLIDPLDYLSFIALMDRSKLILTDSGGIQEEAPSLGKPVLVLREATERAEAVREGCAKIVGTNTARIVRNVTELLTNQDEYQRMAIARNPFGDGKSAERIVETLVSHFFGTKTSMLAKKSDLAGKTEMSNFFGMSDLC